MWSLYRTPWDLERLFAPANIKPQRSTTAQQQTHDSKYQAPQSAHAQCTQTADSSFFKQG